MSSFCKKIKKLYKPIITGPTGLYYRCSFLYPAGSRYDKGLLLFGGLTINGATMFFNRRLIDYHISENKDLI